MGFHSPLKTFEKHSNHQQLTIFDLRNISHHQVSHRDLDDGAIPHHSETLFLLDATLQPPELLLLAPVIEGCHQHHTNDRKQDGCPLDPARLRLSLII